MSSECPNTVIILSRQQGQDIFNYTSYRSVPFQIESPYSYNWCRSTYSTAWSNRSGPLITSFLECEERKYQAETLTGKA